MAKGTLYPHVRYYLKKYQRAQGRVLEIGCGAAKYREFIGPQRYIGSDVPNPYYQDQQSVDVYNRGEFLPYANNSFDLIFSQGAIDYIEGMAAMLRETFRILSPYGKMLVFTYSKANLLKIHERSEQFSSSARSHHHVYDEKEMIRRIREPGFEVRQLPFIARPHLPLMPMICSLPLVPTLINTRTSWRNYLAWKN